MLKVAAAVFLAAMAAYSAGMIYYFRHSLPTGTIGASYQFVDTEQAMRIDHVGSAGPAERVGLRAGDRVIRVNGRPLITVYPFWDAVERGQPGATVEFTVRRPADSQIREVSVPLEAPPVPAYIGTTLITGTHIAALHVLSFYPIPFLLVAGVVLIQRSHDRHAWLLAVMFAGFVAGTELPHLQPVIHPALRKPLTAYWALWAPVPPGALYCFFTSFPEATPLDRRLPWLKAAFLVPPLVIGVSLATATLLSPGRPSFLTLPAPRQATIDVALGIYTLAGYALGLAALVWNAFRGRPETRRRTRVILWGTAAALLPITILGCYAVARGMQFVDFPFWLWVGAILTVYLLPLSFGYAVVRHRVMEIPVLLRRSARYVAVRHAIVTVGILVGVGLTFIFALVFARALPHVPATAVSPGPLSAIAGAVFGLIVAIATRKGVRDATERLDRAFFREAYDARQLLQDLARRTRAATDRRQLAKLLEDSLTDALHPSVILVLLRTPADRLEPVDPRPDIHVEDIDATAVEAEPLARAGAALVRPNELPSSLASLAAVQPDLLVPMQGHDERLEGLLVLGARLSEEPYGREDRELVASVASQAGTALQNLRLAGVIAERLEAERRAGRELEIAREVQAHLLPQRVPAVASLDYAGVCIQARQVGGDYYDFLCLGPGRLGLVLADISGKGISAALLMASLQASLRGEYAQAPDDLPRVLRAVNRTFFESTASNRYATLFFGIYDEGTGRLRYVNCGHVPPVLLARHGAIERLPPTAPVIGLFEEWTCTTREVDLNARDILVMFSDGVVEAFNAEGEEFGEERLVELLRQPAGLTPAMLIDRVVAAVRRHSGRAQSDDVTLVVARGREVSP